MANLKPVTDTNTQFLPVDTSNARVPVARGEKIRMTEAVPGGEDNSADDWRKKHVQDASAVRTLAQHNAEKLAALETEVEAAWGAFDANDVQSGYAQYVGEARPSDFDFGPANDTYTYSGSVSPVVWLRTPKGVDPTGRVRVVVRRGGAVRSTRPGSGEEWGREVVGSPDNAAFDYYRLESETSGSGIGLSGASDDTITFELAAQSHVRPVNDVLAFDSLPAPAPYRVGQYIIAGGLHYELTEAAANVVSGTPTAITLSDGMAHGIILPGFPSNSGLVVGGQFEHNPGSIVRAVFWREYTPGNVELVAWVQDDAYGRARGSVARDELRMVLTEGQSSASIGLRWVRGWTLAGRLGRYAEFSRSFRDYTTDAEATKARAILVGTDEFDVALYAAQTADEDHRVSGLSGKGWSERVNPDIAKNTEVAESNRENAVEILNGLVDARRRVAALEAGDPHVEARFASLEDKTSAIAFDDAVEWEDVTDPQGANYGRIVIVPAGDALTSYTDGLNATGSNSFGGSYTVAASVDNVGLVWVARNDTTWSRIKLQIRSPGGRLRLDLVLGSLRDAPAAVRAAVNNIPDAPPDRTVRWPAISDTQPHSLIDLHVGDVITVQALSEEHVPRWDGDLSEKREAFFKVLEAQLDTAHLRALGPFLGEYQWPDYRLNNETALITPRDRSQTPPGDLEGVAVDPTTGLAYLTTRVLDGTGRLYTFDPDTGRVRRVGNVVDFDAASQLNAASRIEMYGISIDEGGDAYVTFFVEDTTTVSQDPNSAVISAEVWRISLTTGGLTRRIAREVLASGLNAWRNIAVDDQYVYVTRTHAGPDATASHDMLRIPKAGGPATKVNAGALTDGSTVQSIAYSPLWMELVALGADHRIRVWNAAATQFRAVTPASASGIESDNGQYALFFSRPGSLLEQIRSLNDRSPVLIGTTNTLPTSAGTLTPSVDINLIWTASGGLGVTVGGDQPHPARELRIPKVLPERFTNFRVELRVGDDVRHRFTIPIGGASDDANDVHTVHDLYVSNNQRLETNMEHYRNQSYDGLRISGTGTSLPANTEVRVYAI